MKRMKTAITAILTSALVVFALSSCQSAKRSAEIPEGAMALEISSNGTVVTYLLNDSEAAKDLYSQLPLNVDLSGGIPGEFIIDQSLNEGTDPVIPKEGKTGDLMYNPNFGEIVILYSNFKNIENYLLLGTAIDGANSIWTLGEEAYVGRVK